MLLTVRLATFCLIVLAITDVSASVGDVQNASEFHAIGVIFGDDILGDNVHRVVQQSLSLDDEQRFTFLADQIFLGGAAPRIRLAGKFIPSDWASGTEPRQSAAGVLHSPLFELLDLAKQTGRLRELNVRASTAVPANEHQQRARAALLSLIAVESGDTVTFDEQFNQLFDLVRTSTPNAVYDQWPETLVAYRIVHRFPRWEAIADLLEYMREQRVRQDIPEDNDALQTHLWSLAAVSRLQLRSSLELLSSTANAQWSPVLRYRAETRGHGFPQASWLWRNGVGIHVAGHESDLLYFRSPLTGDFEVEADVTSSGKTEVLSAGILIGHTWDGKGIHEGSVRMGVTRRPLDRPLGKMEKWTRYRATYRGDECRVYLNGRIVKVIDRSSTDPWVALRSYSRNDARFRDVRITGNPVIPKRVSLIGPELAGWSDYFDKSSFPGPAWEYGEDSEGHGEIRGHCYAQLQGTSAERLLSYVRPLGQADTIEYEFQHSDLPGHVHPAIGRLAFLLSPDGVQIHEITDAAFDQTLRTPDNWMQPADVLVDRLPLNQNSWNRITLNMNGDDVALNLNGQLIFKHRLSADNNRQFGVFHYAGHEAARIRDVTLSGSWAKVLPSLEEQVFADSEAAKLDRTRPAEVYRHDFVGSGLDERFFSVSGNASGQISATDDGVFHVVRSSGKWIQSQLAPTFRMDGDFDVSATFDSMSVTGEEFNGCGLVVTTADGYSCRVGPKRQGTNNYRVSVRWGEPNADGEVRHSYEHIASEAISGTLRVARRGDRVVALFAENDSDQFRVIGTRDIADSAEYGAEANMLCIANAGGATSVLWKSLQISAHRLWHLPNPNEDPQRVLFTMNVDGSGVRQITQELPDIDNQGSPDWSPDGRQIAFDGWSGSAETARVYLVNVDGTNLRDIGIGAMPTFSPDGKRLALTWSPHGMATMNTDGVDRKVLSSDGWGAQWSPNGKWVAYQSRERVNGQSQTNITIIDVRTLDKRILLKGDDASKYRQIYWNMEWSPDSRQICFKGDVSGGKEVGLASVDGSPVRVLTTANVYEDFAWHPDGSKILMSGPLLQLGGTDSNSAYSSKGYRLYQFDLKSGQMALLPHQPMDRDSNSASWSPDGTQLAFVSRALPGPVRWTSKQTPSPSQDSEQE